MPSVDPTKGPVAVTGASGYVGSHCVGALLKRGYTVHACVTDVDDPEKTGHLHALDAAHPGNVKLFAGDLFVPGSYDESLEGCCAVLHVGTAMAYGGKHGPRSVYDGAVEGTGNVLGSVKKAGTIRRFVYTSSFAAIHHPAPSGYLFTEADWASDNRERDKNWNEESIDTNGTVAYAMAKVETEHIVNRAAEEDGRFDAISVCPCVVLGPLLSQRHDLGGSWQWNVARMLEGQACPRGWQGLWNVVDVRDVGEAQALILESETCISGARYQLTASDESGELDVWQLEAHLRALFPDLDINAVPAEMDAFLERRGGKIHDGPRARCDKARAELGLEPHSVDDTLGETGRTLIELGLCEPGRASE